MKQLLLVEDDKAILDVSLSTHHAKGRPIPDAPNTLHISLPHASTAHLSDPAPRYFAYAAATFFTAATMSAASAAPQLSNTMSKNCASVAAVALGQGKVRLGSPL